MSDPRFVHCDVCGTEGRIYRSAIRCGEPTDEDEGECPECEGAGQLLVEVFPIELEDLDER